MVLYDTQLRDTLYTIWHAVARHPVHHTTRSCETPCTPYDTQLRDTLYTIRHAVARQPVHHSTRSCETPVHHMTHSCETPCTPYDMHLRVTLYTMTSCGAAACCEASRHFRRALADVTAQARRPRGCRPRFDRRAVAQQRLDCACASSPHSVPPAQETETNSALRRPPQWYTDLPPCTTMNHMHTLWLCVASVPLAVRLPTGVDEDGQSGEGGD
jgi:hypothetical protein